MAKTSLFSILLAGLATIITASVALADIGPKPMMHFTIDPHLDLSTLTLLVCQKADCADEHPLPVLGPQGLHCRHGARTTVIRDDCYAVAYGFPPYARLEAKAPSGLPLRSNIFAHDTFDASYRVTLTGSSLEVTNLEVTK